MPASWDPWATEEQPAHSITPVESSSAEPYAELPAQQLKRPGENADFLSILALAQRLQIDFLPIVWYPEIDTIGAGTTAEIRQALVTVQMGLAFKRIKRDREETFSALFSEISILGIPAVLEHENIVTLEGICWDVNPTGAVVWPVLVFQKAAYGSLEDCMMLSSGRRPSLESALSILADVARGLSCLHSHNIIHGDLKPDNILVFKTNNNDGFLAKIADLGYSTQVFDNAPLRVSTKQPWADAQYRGEWIGLDTGKKMDSYSFGMICAWMMSHYFPIPADSRLAATASPSSAVRQDTDQPKLGDFTNLLDSDVDLPSDIRQVLSSSLDPDRGSRCTNFSVFLQLLRHPGLDKLSLSDIETSLSVDTTVPEFEISSVYFRLLQANPMLPAYVLSELQKQAQNQEVTRSSSNAAFQLALCYSIGFGARRDLETAHTWLEQSARAEEQLQHEIAIISQEHRWLLKGKVARSLELDGSLHLLDPRLWEDDTEVLVAAETYYQNLIEDLDQVFAPDHSAVVLARFLLASIFNQSGRYIEALKIFSDLAHLMQQEDSYGMRHSSTLTMVAETAGMHFKLGDYRDAEIWYRDALQGQIETLGSQHPETLKTMIALSQTLGNIGKQDEAEVLVTEALNNSRTRYGDDHPETWSALAALCHTLSEKGNYEEAAVNLRKAIAGRERVLGARSAETMIAKSNLAAIYHLQGKLEQAKGLVFEIRHDLNETLGRLHPNSFHLLGTLASTMHAMGENEEAKRINRRLLEMQDIIGINNPYNLKVKSNLALISQEEGYFDEALKLDSEILERRLVLLGKGHPDTLTTLNNIAACFHRMGKYSEAKRKYEEVLECRLENLGSTHPSTLAVRSNLAQVLHDIGQYNLAIAQMQEIIDAYTLSVGPLHPSTLLAVNNLGSSLLSIGDKHGAIEKGSQAYEGMLTVLGPKHRDTVRALDNLAVALSESQRFEEARQLFELELLAEPVFGPDDSLMLTANHNYGHLFYNQAQLDTALLYLTKAANGRQKTLGKTHPQTLDSLHDIALVHFAKQQNDEAAKIFRSVWEIRKVNLGPTHPATSTTISNLASTLANCGNYAEAEKLHSEAVQARKAVFGENDTRTIDSRYRLALASHRLGHYAPAEEEFRIVLQHFDTNPSFENDRMLNVLFGIGSSCQAQDKFSDALEILERCFKLAKDIPGKELFACQTQARIAMVHQDSGNLQSAISTYEKALKGYESVGSDSDLELLDIQMSLASALLKVGEAPKALPLFTRAAEESESLGASQETRLNLWKNIGLTYLVMDLPKEALVYMQKARDGYAETFGPEHADTQDCEETLVLIHDDLKSLTSGEPETL